MNKKKFERVGEGGQVLKKEKCYLFEEGN